MSRYPLQDILVLDLTRLLPGPLCSLMLADLGATIYKIEPPEGGDYTRWYPPIRNQMSGGFAALNRNKRSLVLDLKSTEGVEVVRRMISRVDVLLEGFRPGVMQRLGLDYETLHTQHPRLIYGSISGYGQDGPLAHRAGHDINYLARTGVLSLLGQADGPPVVPGIQIADVTGGSWMGVSHVLAALFHREKTGEGCHCDIAMSEGLLPFLTMELGQMAAGGETPRRGQTLLGGGVPCYGVYRCRDGKYLAVGALEPKFWSQLTTALERPDLTAQGLLLNEDGEPARTALAHIFLSRDRDEWVHLLTPLDACVEPVLDLDEVFTDPQALARSYFVTHEHPTEGTFSLPRSPFRMSNIPSPPHEPAPLLGQHGRDILQEFGFSTQDIESLIKQGVVGTS